MSKKVSRKRKGRRLKAVPKAFLQGLRKDLGEAVLFEVAGLFALVVASLFLYSLYAPETGFVGNLVGRGLKNLLGGVSFVVPLLLAFWGLGMVTRWKRLVSPSAKLGGLICTVMLPAFANGIGDGMGGGAGAALDSLLLRGFGPGGRVLILYSSLVIGIILITSQSPAALLGRLAASLAAVRGRLVKRERIGHGETPEGQGEAVSTDKLEGVADGGSVSDQQPYEEPSFTDVYGEDQVEPHADEQDSPPGFEPAAEAAQGLAADAEDQPHPVAVNGASQLALSMDTVYELPPLSLLRTSRGRSARGNAPREVAAKKKLLEDTLRSFGVEVKVLEVEQGPAVTRFEVQPAPGVKVARIASLADDIALSMAASGVRIVAPIPGKAALGIEVPNAEISTVYLKDVLESRQFKQSPARLPVALGEDISGNPVVSSMERMVHLLVAGATGSGKSVCVNAILCSLLYRATPLQLRLLLIDPKVVELSGYNGIPHLLSPVVTDPRRAAGCLKWVVREMERRYAAFAEAGVRDISRYNSTMLMKGEEELPYIVVVVDELADLMMVAPGEVEDSVQRLAQMARAAGIHLILATQRPSVDVITGVIKANIPSRIAFAVSSQVDSRTILDTGGAEKLLGRGDMLFHPMGGAKPVRVQGAYIPESDLEVVLHFIKRQGDPKYKSEVFDVADEQSEAAEEEGDNLFPEAVKVVLETGQASVSIVQRKLRVGYTRAGRLIDMMEERRIVGPHQGPKPREILISQADYRRLFGEKTDNQKTDNFKTG